MSHFAVLVIGDDPEGQLAPYSEHIDGNPNPKWDWYVLGGRWTGAFPLLPGATGKVGRPGVMTEPPAPGLVDQARVEDIDWVQLGKNLRAEAEKSLAENDCRRKGETKKEYIARCSKFTTYAVVKDGEWYQRGEVGWFGTASYEKTEGDWDAEFDRLLAGLPGDTLLSFYDCHI